MGCNERILNPGGAAIAAARARVSAKSKLKNQIRRVFKSFSAFEAVQCVREQFRPSN